MFFFCKYKAVVLENGYGHKYLFIERYKTLYGIGITFLLFLLLLFYVFTNINVIDKIMMMV